MPISRVRIKNCKSIKDLLIPFNHVNCLLGENGTGKTNILKTIKYFYDNLVEKNSDDSLCDKVNPYIQSFEITFYYDFSRLKKIAESHFERISIYDDYSLNPIFKKIKNIDKKYSDQDGDIKITLNQNKNGIQKWNVPYEIRAFIKNIFPIYFSQTRHLNLINWDDLWEIIGELSKIGVAKNTSYREELEECFKNAFGERYSTILSYIKTEFVTNDIDIKAFNSNQQFANMYQLQLGGNSFKHKLEELEYFSDGINSYNYLKLLINLISKISDRKIKEPTIIIDEPEIGLHPRYIDEMVDIFSGKSDYIKILLSTHSSRIIKNLMSDSSKVNLYHISMESEYSKLKRINRFTDKRELNIVTEQESSYYFAKNIVFVEGATELELFSNKYILKLFPFLKEIDFYSYDGNSLKLKIIHPHEKNTSIPYLILLDLDQILKYDKTTSEFTIKKGDKVTNPLKEGESVKKEILYYGSKREKTYNIRKRILGIISKSKFHFDSNWGYILGESTYFNRLRNLIRIYSLQYNILPVFTTIEGALINRVNHPLVYNWLKLYKKKEAHKKAIDQIYNFKNTSAYKTTVLRLVNDGKFDNLETVNEWIGKIKDISDQNIKEIFENVAKVKNSKASGWVTDFINYFFESNISNLELTQEEEIDIFKKNFPEIYLIVTSIKTIMK